MGNLKCGMSQKRLIVERMDENLGLSVLQCTSRVLLMPDSLSLVVWSFGALCKISDSTIFETPLLQQFSSHFNQTSKYHNHTKYHNLVLIHDITFLAICQKLKFYDTLKFFSTQDHMGL